jgi:predicted DCC family thiol-disulfide oxidoreductase YuxK
MTGPVLIYDGECPFCANYVELLDLRTRFPGLELVDARSNGGHPAIGVVKARGLRIDDGMALVDGDEIHHGADAIHRLAQQQRGGSAFSAVNTALFKSSARSRLIYPLLRRGRDLVLRMMGRVKLGY